MDLSKRRIEPFRGKVNVMFRDAMVASTDEALVGVDAAESPVYFIPFKHIYFEFLHEEPHAAGGLRTWRASAVGEAAGHALVAYTEPPEGHGVLRDHGAFDPAIVTVEAMETPDTEHRVHWPD
jgi:uncharacterized protein (DUF427 family)